MDRMIEEADIKPGMSVLEPEAGMEPHCRPPAGSRSRTGSHGDFPVKARIAAGEGVDSRWRAKATSRRSCRTFHTFGDTFKAPDGTVGIMRGQGGMGSDRVRPDDEQEIRFGYYNRDELTPSAIAEPPAVTTASS